MTTASRNQGNLISHIFRRGREERLAQAAGGLTFTMVVSMVPLLAVSFALFAQTPALRAAGEAIREHLLRGLLPAVIAWTVLKHLAQFAGNMVALTKVPGATGLSWGEAFAAISSIPSLEHTRPNCVESCERSTPAAPGE